MEKKIDVHVVGWARHHEGIPATRSTASELQKHIKTWEKKKVWFSIGYSENGEIKAMVDFNRRINNENN